ARDIGSGAIRDAVVLRLRRAGKRSPDGAKRNAGAQRACCSESQKLTLRNGGGRLSRIALRSIRATALAIPTGASGVPALRGNPPASAGTLPPSRAERRPAQRPSKRARSRSTPL